MIPIHYERPSICLQRERPCSKRSGVGGRGSATAKSRGAGTSPAHCFVVFTFSLTPDLASPHPTGWFNPLILPGAAAASGAAAAAREGRAASWEPWRLQISYSQRWQSNCHVADSWEGISASKEGQRPLQVAKRLAWTLSPATLLICKILYIFFFFSILYILNQLHQRLLGAC